MGWVGIVGWVGIGGGMRVSPLDGYRSGGGRPLPTTGPPNTDAIPTLIAYLPPTIAHRSLSRLTFPP